MSKVNPLNCKITHVESYKKPATTFISIYQHGCLLLACLSSLLLCLLTAWLHNKMYVAIPTTVTFFLHLVVGLWWASQKPASIYLKQGHSKAWAQSSDSPGAVDIFSVLKSSLCILYILEISWQQVNGLSLM